MVLSVPYKKSGGAFLLLHGAAAFDSVSEFISFFKRYK